MRRSGVDLPFRRSPWARRAPPTNGWGRFGFGVASAQVLSKAHGRVTVQFLNKKDRKTDPTSNLKLVWYRRLPSSNVFDDGATDSHEEIYQDKLTNKQMADGYLPWTDTFDLDDPDTGRLVSEV